MLNRTKITATVSLVLLLIACQRIPIITKPLATASPMLVPSSSASSSSVPSAGPEDNRLIIHASNTQIVSPIQALISNNNTSLLMWQEQAENSNTIINHGRWLNSSAKAFQFNAGSVFDMNAFSHGNTLNTGLLVWNVLIPDSIGFGNPKALQSLEFNNGSVSSVRQIGSFTLHDLSLNEAGNGYLVVSNEKERLASQTNVYLIPVQNHNIQIKAIDYSNLADYNEQVRQQESSLQTVYTMPGNFRGADMVLAAKITATGEGLIIWRDLEGSAVKVVQIKNFKAVSSSEKLVPVNFESFLPARLDVPQVLLKLENENGYMAWPSNNQLHFLEIKNNAFLADSKSISLPTQMTCTPLAGAKTAPAWDLDVDVKGNGIVSWTEANRKQVQIRRIQNFQFASETHFLTSPEALDVCMTKVRDLGQNEVLIAGLSASCSDNICNNVDRDSKRIIWSQKLNMK